ncbi:MAG TPA: aspartate--tRNA ligase [Tepidisphaeraceae bacterium]|nr:aspartate--tRNA ligase [Tepidisphaeraceae bacterium]
MQHVQTKFRSHTCGQLRSGDIPRKVQLAGWVDSYRDHGGLVFIDLRDREGVTQVVFDPDSCGKDVHDIARSLRTEWVISVEGEVEDRGADDKGRSLHNAKLATGDIEIRARAITVLSQSPTPPFLPSDEGVSEERRLKYRFIDLRRPDMLETLRVRYQLTRIMRDFLGSQGFWEIETPMLTKSTPEGARDFIVPSRHQPGNFYALPQSPQLFKQLLMVSGCDKYMQIVRCFRDEDPRADRQAEFTQLDLEMSFVDREDVIGVVEKLTAEIWKGILGKEVSLPIPHITYDVAMDTYGSDRPDLRFDMQLHNITDIAHTTDFGVFKSAPMVKCIVVPDGSKMTRAQTDGLAEWAKTFGAKGLAVTKVAATGFDTGVAKFINPVAAQIIERTGAKEGDLLAFAADKPKVVHKVLGELRLKLARDLNIKPKADFAFVWVIDFPAFEYDAEEKRFVALHHPFTAPKDDELHKLDSREVDVVESIKAKAYDLVLNGSEVAGGSIRIHRMDIQSKVFSLLGIDVEAQRAKFGFLLDGLQFGAPPHGGIAFGVDRWVMLLRGTDNIRDVIAFPKTQSGADLMCGAPSSIDDRQLRDTHIRVNLPPKVETPKA